MIPIKPTATLLSLAFALLGGATAARSADATENWTTNCAAEWLLDSIFTAGGAVYDTQVEIVHPQEPMKAHLDFLFYEDFDGKPDLHAIEVKSVSGIPDAPYTQWEDQLTYQLGLLRTKYPKGEVTGSILAVDLNAGEIEHYTGY